jgi:excisionase family DNA binding protein
MNEKQGDSGAPRELLSVREASSRLRVSESTVWRWIDRGVLRAYRVGPKRVLLKASELSEMVQPARRVHSADAELRDRLRLVPMSNNPDPNAMERAREFRQRLLAERGGVPFPESWPEIDEAREERSRELE